MRNSLAILLLLLLLTGAFALGTSLQWRALHWTRCSPSDSVLKLVLGDSERMFANHFFVKADISFHSGYYPSLFDQARREEEKENAVANQPVSGDGHVEQDHDVANGFLGPPTDWIDRFSRHFRPPKHTELEGANTREILPWLRISAELDPHRIETYTVASYFLRKNLGKVDEAEQFLREGVRNNPTSYEILFELGRLYNENRHDADRARNVWQLALRRWEAQSEEDKQKSTLALDQITVNLGRLEDAEGDYERAIEYLEMARRVSPQPEVLQQQIGEIKRKLASSAAGKRQ